LSAKLPKALRPHCGRALERKLAAPMAVDPFLTGPGEVQRMRRQHPGISQGRGKRTDRLRGIHLHVHAKGGWRSCAAARRIDVERGCRLPSPALRHQQRRDPLRAHDASTLRQLVCGRHQRRAGAAAQELAAPAPVTPYGLVVLARGQPRRAGVQPTTAGSRARAILTTRTLRGTDGGRGAFRSPKSRPCARTAFLKLARTAIGGVDEHNLARDLVFDSACDELESQLWLRLEHEVGGNRLTRSGSCRSCRECPNTGAAHRPSACLAWGTRCHR
jgi:hypothetical protein